ncbi:hypothetical protein FRB97_005951, partial [Tulasnella sp. 331]
MSTYIPLNGSAINFNVTIDDWASILNYANPSDWETPDPQSPALATTPWLEGTWHKTGVVNASITLNFEGPAIYIFGASGPQYGSYAITVDGTEWTYSAYAATNASNYLLYGNPNLSYGNHQLEIRNLGAFQATDHGASAFLLDYILATVQLGPQGTTVTNTTVEDNNPSVTYSGTWTSQSNALFSGGTSMETVQQGGSASLSFTGTAVYIFGDSANNQGSYSVVLDSGPPQTYNTLLGCGGGTSNLCQKTQPSLKYYASNLNSSQHTITVTNNANPSGASFNLDRFVYTTPSVYAPVNVSATSNSTFVSPTSTGSTSSTSAPKASSASRL